MGRPYRGAVKVYDKSLVFTLVSNPVILPS
jgi:hypothetical protein